MTRSKTEECIINFVWKFNRNQHVHNQELNEKMLLLNAYIASHAEGNSIIKLELYPVERLGMSGSKVFYLDVSYNSGPKEMCVAKFNSADKTYREFKSATVAKRLNLCNQIYSSQLSETSEASEAKQGLLIYKFARLAHSRAIEFRDFYLDRDVRNSSCVAVLTKLYNDTIYLDPEDLESGKKVHLVDSYKWYIERETAPLIKLKQLSFGHETDYESDFSKKSSKILSFYNKLISETEYSDIQVVAVFQHGDLHARNILLDPQHTERQPDLIDFDWADYSHAGRDFSILETTIKYMLIQNYSSKNLSGDEKYTLPLAYIKLEILLCKCGLDFPDDSEPLFIKYNINTNESIIRAYECIKVIRTNAKRFLDRSFKGDRPFTIDKEYFLSLFLISLGHIAFTTSDDYWVLNGCDILVDHIEHMD